MRAYLIKGLEVFVGLGAVIFVALSVIQGVQNNGLWGGIFGFIVGTMFAAIIFGALAALLDIREQTLAANKLLKQMNDKLTGKYE